MLEWKKIFRSGSRGWTGKMTEKYLTGSEVTDILKISKDTLKSWRKSGKMPYIKVSPKKLLYSQTDVNKILGRKENLPKAKRSFLVSSGCTLQLSDVQPMDIEKLKVAGIVFRDETGDLTKILIEGAKFFLSSEGAWVSKFPFQDCVSFIEATPDMIRLPYVENLIGCVIEESE